MSTATSPIAIEVPVVDFLRAPKKLLINGKWVEAASGKTFETYDPDTGEVLAMVVEGDAEDIERAVRAARRAFDGGPWSGMTPSRNSYNVFDAALPFGGYKRSGWGEGNGQRGSRAIHPRSSQCGWRRANYRKSGEY